MGHWIRQSLVYPSNTTSVGVKLGVDVDVGVTGEGVLVAVGGGDVLVAVGGGDVLVAVGGGTVLVGTKVFVGVNVGGGIGVLVGMGVMVGVHVIVGVSLGVGVFVTVGVATESEADRGQRASNMSEAVMSPTKPGVSKPEKYTRNVPVLPLDKRTGAAPTIVGELESLGEA
jgi:hypothetical protein